MQTRLLPAEVVTEYTGIADVVDAVGEAFAADARGDVQMPAKSYIDLPQYNGDFRSMPAYLDTGEWDAAAVKWVNVHPDNEEQFDLPTVMGTIVYSDPRNAFPLALIDGTTKLGAFFRIVLPLSAPAVAATLAVGSFLLMGATTSRRSR